MTQPNAIYPRQIGDGAGQLEDTVIGAGGELELAHRGLHQVFAGLVQGAELAHIRWAHICVASDPVLPLKSRPLTLARRFHPVADGCARIAHPVEESFSYSTRGTSMWISIRSSSGPEMPFWYFVTTMLEQVQGLTESP
jgi:hypothetical protein